MSSGDLIARNTLFLYLRMGLVLLVGLYTTRVVLNVLGVEEYGVYNIVCGFVSMFGVLNTSMSNGINRFYNVAIGKNNLEDIKRVYNTALVIQLLVAAIVFILVEAIGVWYLNKIMVIPHDRITVANYIFQFSVFSLLLLIMQAPYSAAVMAYERMDYYAIVSIVDVSIKLLIVIALKRTTYDKLLFYGLLMAIVSIVNFLLYFIYCRKKFVSIRCDMKVDHSLFKEMLSFSGWSLLDPLSYTARGQGCNMILNFYFGPILNAAYSISNQIAVALDSFSMNLSTAYRPQIIQSYAGGDYNRTNNLVFSMSKIMYMLNLMLFLPVILEIRYLLTLWLGDSFPSEAILFTVLFMFVKLITVFTPPLTNVMNAMGKIRKIMIYTAVIICSIIPVSIILFELSFDSYYLYVAMLVLTVINQVISVVIVSKAFEQFNINCYLRNVILPCFEHSLIVFVPLFVVYKLLPSSILRVFLICVLSFICSVISGYFVILDKNEQKKAKTLMLSRIFECNRNE